MQRSAKLSFDLSSILGTGEWKSHATVALGYQFESTTFVVCSPIVSSRLFGGRDEGSGDAGIWTLGCSKNRWEDFEGQGGTAGVAGSRLLATGDCG
jgi:hypothetical protein